MAPGLSMTTASIAVPPATPATPLALVPAWLLGCYFLIIVVGGVIANVLLLVTTARTARWCRAGLEVSDADAASQDGAGDPSARRGDKGWWFLLGQLAATDALSLCLVSGGELWSVRETGGPWRLPAGLCTPFMGLEAMLGAAQTYLLVALALHASTAPADPVPRLSVWRHVTRSAVVPSALVWMLASSVAVPRTFLAVPVWPRPTHPLCTLVPTSPATGGLEGPMDVVGGLGPSGSWWPLGALGVDGQGGGPLLSAVVLCAAPALALLALLASASAAAMRAAWKDSGRASGRSEDEDEYACAPHKVARREWRRVSAWLSLSWLLLSLPRLAGASVHGFLPPDAAPNAQTASASLGPWAFRAPPLGSRALGDDALLAASMLHYALTAARPVVAVLASPSLRRAALATALASARGAETPTATGGDDEGGRIA